MLQSVCQRIQPRSTPNLRRIHSDFAPEGVNEIMEDFPSTSSLNSFVVNTYFPQEPKARDWPCEYHRRSAASIIPTTPYTWDSSKDNIGGGKPESFTSIFPIPLAGLQIRDVYLDGKRWPFLCAVLAQYRAFDIPFGLRIALVDFILHRLEVACHGFVLHFSPETLETMCIEELDILDLEDWHVLIAGIVGQLHLENKIDGIIREPPYDLAVKIRNTAVHARNYGLGLIVDAIRWMLFLKNEAFLSEI